LKHPVLLDEQITSVGFSPDGQRAFSAWTDGNIRVWDLASGIEMLGLWGHERITSVAFTPYGRMIVSAQFGNDLQLWDVTQSKELRFLGPACYQVTVLRSALMARPCCRDRSTEACATGI
jgi:WD40 repeat protein